MSVLKKYSPAKGQDEDDRWRQYGLTSFFIGLPILAFIVLTIVLLGEASHYLSITVSLALLTLCAVGLSCFFNWHVRNVLLGALLALYVNMWSVACWEILAGDIKQHLLPVMLFTPLVVALLMNHRMIFTLIPVQFYLIYLSTKAYATHFFSSEFSPHNIEILGIMFAILSTITFFMVALTAYIRDKNDEKFRRAIAEKKALALTDDLTGLSNRRAFFEYLENELKQSDMTVLAYIDLVRFKPINDQYGHAAGDALLQEISRRLMAESGVKFTARLGGDEFALILDENMSEEQIDQLIQKIHKEITSDFNIETRILNVGASIGYATAPQDIRNFALLLPAAEIAMRRAKRNGDGWVRYNDRFDDALMGTSTMEIAFKKAITTGKIRAAIQPITDARTLEVTGYELLSRWVDSGLKYDPSPEQFIPVAEKLGLLNKLLWLTLDQVLSQTKIDLKKLSINVSPAQIVAADFIENLITILNTYGFSPKNITLEITEQVAFRNLDQNIKVLEKARRLGMSVALDDFGTGYSSLLVVDRLPLDKIKIDQSLVKNMNINSRTTAIITTAIQMARQLQLSCCVEGVESQGIAAKITQLGVDELQGHYFGKPRLVSASPALIKAA